MRQQQQQQHLNFRMGGRNQRPIQHAWYFPLSLTSIFRPPFSSRTFLFTNFGSRFFSRLFLFFFLPSPTEYDFPAGGHFRLLPGQTKPTQPPPASGEPTKNRGPLPLESSSPPVSASSQQGRRDKCKYYSLRFPSPQTDRLGLWFSCSFFSMTAVRSHPRQVRPEETEPRPRPARSCLTRSHTMPHMSDEGMWSEAVAFEGGGPPEWIPVSVGFSYKAMGVPYTSHALSLRDISAFDVALEHRTHGTREYIPTCHKRAVQRKPAEVCGIWHHFLHSQARATAWALRMVLIVGKYRNCRGWTGRDLENASRRVSASKYASVSMK